MRKHPFPFLAAALVLVGFASAGCVGRTETAPLVRVPVQPSAQAGCSPSARAVAPGYTFALADPVGVASEVGPVEHARAIAGIPGNAIGCATSAAGRIIVHVGEDVRDGVNCWLDSMKPTPSVRYLYQQPAAAAAPACGGCGPTCGVPTPTPIPLPPQGPGGGLEPNIPDTGAVRR